MNDKRKIEIINVTVALAAKRGLKNVTLSMIANELGIKKPSLYNHFSSKDEIIAAAYSYLREEAKNKTAAVFGEESSFNSPFFKKALQSDF